MKPKNEYSRFSFSSICCDLDTGDTSEEVKAFMKLRKSLAHSLNIVNIFLKPSSSLWSTAPIESIDIANTIPFQISSLSKNVDDKLISMSEYLFSKICDC